MTAPDQALATKVARAELMKRIGILVTAVMVAAVLAVVLLQGDRSSDVVDEIRATQQANSPTVKAARDAAQAAQSTNDQILDCLEPTGQCYQDSQKRTAGYLADFNRVVIYAAACASGPGKFTVEQIQACVIDRLASDPPPAQP